MLRRWTPHPVRPTMACLSGTVSSMVARKHPCSPPVLGVQPHALNQHHKTKPPSLTGVGRSQLLIPRCLPDLAGYLTVLPRFPWLSNRDNRSSFPEPQSTAGRAQMTGAHAVLVLAGGPAGPPAPSTFPAPRMVLVGSAEYKGCGSSSSGPSLGKRNPGHGGDGGTRDPERPAFGALLEWCDQWGPGPREAG